MGESIDSNSASVADAVYANEPSVVRFSMRTRIVLLRLNCRMSGHASSSTRRPLAACALMPSGQLIIC